VHPEQSGLSFIEDQFRTAIAIDACMAHCEEEIPLFANLDVLLWHSRPTAGASYVPALPLAKRAREVCAAEDVEMPQAVLPSLCKPAARSDSLQQTLPP
jgi:hypothetical protein